MAPTSFQVSNFPYTVHISRDDLYLQIIILNMFMRDLHFFWPVSYTIALLTTVGFYVNIVVFTPHVPVGFFGLCIGSQLPYG